MESVLIIGLGRFGKNMALKMSELNTEVLAVDIEESRVNEVLPFVTGAQIGDSTNDQFIASLGVRNFDLCVVAIGDNFQNSLETTALLKDYGAKFVLARACSDVHAKFLLRNGADRVAYAEKDMAIRMAVRYSSDSIFDYIELTPEYSIYEIEVPHGWVGKTIISAAVRTRHHISILATKENGDIMPQPAPDYVFTGKETLIVMGKNDDMASLLKRQ